MRELWQTGFMHNRVRMVVASFLVKNLLQDWRKGLKWFDECLLDADMANNSFGWQWVAGSGFDAAPYFRIFNPWSQQQKFDPEGENIKKWIPELTSLSPKDIHNWYKIAKVKYLEVSYPIPIVDHKRERELSLFMFKSLYQP